MTLIRKSLLLLVLMLAAFGSAIALRPSIRIAAERPSIDLKALIPAQFGDWREEPQNAGRVVNPQQQELLEKIYSETLSRSYINSKGYRVMLSIAYGGDQTGRLRVHRPESCYSGQGFVVTKIGEDQIRTPIGAIPVKRLAAKSGPRHEPITYWIRIGNTAVTGLLGQRLTQLSYGLTGEVPDGLIFRVSSITEVNAQGYALHDEFIADLMAALPRNSQIILIGGLAADSAQ